MKRLLMSDEKAEKDGMVSERINLILSDTSLDFSVKGLQKIHLLLFNGISSRAEEFRKKFVLPYEDENYLDAEKVKEMGMRFCEKEMLFEEDGFHDLDFMEFIAQSRQPIEQEHFSELINSEA